MRILLVDDDVPQLDLLKTRLESEYFAIDAAEDGPGALELIEMTDYDLVVLESTLPHFDGMSVLQQIRARHMSTPVMFISRSLRVEDRVEALNGGADDFLPKPFVYEEFLARVYALLRRPKTLVDSLTVADLEINRLMHTVKRAGQVIPLTQREYSILEYLARNAERPVSRTMVLQHVWSLGFEGLTNIVDVYINSLRAKLDHGYERKLIHTARGIGYMVSGQQETVAAA